MNVFVTGGAGFIGSHLVDRLVLEGNNVTVYDNLLNGKEDFIKHHYGSGKLKFINGDLLDFNKLKNVIEQHDIVFHLAANSDAAGGIKNTRIDLEQGTIATYNVLEAMRTCDIKKIVFSSSGTVYGNVGTMGVDENFGPLIPTSLYGASKLACEGLITAFCNSFDIQSWIFRFPNVVGDHGTHGVIYDFIKKLRINPHELEVLGNGEQNKSYLFVDDCIEGILLGIRNSDDIVNIFNLGYSDSVYVKKIAQLVINKMKLDAKIKYTGGEGGWRGDIPQTRCNAQKIMELGWVPKMSSLQAIEKTIDLLLKEL